MTMTAHSSPEPTPTPASPSSGGGDTDDLLDLGYDQQLHRSLGKFASFAAGFSFVSILTTIFQLFGLGFGFGGPAFFWTWPIVYGGSSWWRCASRRSPRATRSRVRSTSGRAEWAEKSSAGSVGGS